MRKLALSDEILMKVDKPARYIGNEFNSVMKDTSQVNIGLRCVFLMFMRSVCHIWESRYCMICSTAWMTCGAREFILRGLICMKS